MYRMAQLEDVIMVPGDSNLTFPAHCRLPDTKDVWEQEEVPSPTERRFKLAMNRFRRMPERRK